MRERSKAARRIMRHELDKLQEPDVDPWANEVSEINVQSPFLSGSASFRGRRAVVASVIVALVIAVAIVLGGR